MFVPKSIINSGETYQAVMTCSVLALPKPKVTWEKELINGNGLSWMPVHVESANSRYTLSRLPAPTQNSTLVSMGPSYSLKVKQVQGPQDFGRYRCVAENKFGISRSAPITLTGTNDLPMLF